MRLKYTEFFRKFVNKDLSRLKNPKLSTVEEFILPTGSAVHFVPESPTEVGIDRSNMLIRNAGDKILIHHVEELEVRLGKVRRIANSPSTMIRNYHKKNLTMSKVRNIEKSSKNTSLQLVVNYGLLNKLNAYVPNQLGMYQEWMNLRTTLWSNIKDIGSDRYHFIHYRMPRFLPSKNEFRKFADKFSKTGFVNFGNDEALGLLELWRIVSEDVTSINLGIHENVLSRVNLVFTENGNISVVCLLDLINWSNADPSLTPNSLYNFWEYMLSLRTEMDTASVVVDDDEVEIVIGNTILKSILEENMSAGLLTNAEQRGLLKMSERYKTLPNPVNGEGTLGDMIKDDTIVKVTGREIIKDAITIHDESYKQSTLTEMDSLYVKETLHKDVLRTVMMFQNAGLIVKNVSIKDTVDAANVTQTYSIQIQPVGGKSSTMSFTLPIVNANGTFFANGVLYRLDRQRGDVPIFKTKPFTVALTSYFGKLFLIRNQNSSANWDKWIKKQLISRSIDSDDSSVTKLTYGLNTFKGLDLPRHYTSIGSVISSFKSGKYTFYWNHSVLNDNFSDKEISELEKMDMVPCGRDTSGVLGMDSVGSISHLSKGKNTSLGLITGIIDSEMGNGPIEYTELSIFSKRLPLIIVFSYITGLEHILKQLSIPFTTIPTGARYVARPDIFRVKFKDLSYLIDISDPAHSLLIGGFNAFRKITPAYKAADWEKRSVYLSVISKLGMGQSHLREIKLIFDMFIDPITLGILKKMKEPTTIRKLLLKGNRLLINDHMPVIEDFRIKGYERLAGMVYTEMISSIRGYRVRGNVPNAEVTMNPSAVWLSILKDQSIVIVEESNPLHNLKEKESVTFSGAGGRSSRSMVKSTRAFKSNDVGIISEASPDSAKVGIRTFLTANPNFTDVRGLVREYDPATDGAANALSTTALISPAVTHDDAKRVNHISVQHGHGVACDNYSPLPFRTGYEQVIANRVDDIFAVNAEQSGKVIKLTDTFIELEFKDGSVKSYPLGIQHGRVSDSYVPHVITTDLKVGSKFKDKDVVTWNSGFFERDILNPSVVAYKAGAMATVALFESSSTIEDGCIISDNLTKSMSTNKSIVRPIMVEFTDSILNLIKVGTVVDPETILCTIESGITGDISEKDSDIVDALRSIAASNPKSEKYGTVSKIEVLFNGDPVELSDSLTAIVKSDNSNRVRNNKQFGNRIPKTGRINSVIHIGGKKLLPGNLVVKIYIDSTVIMGTGDKVVFGNGLKSTISKVPVDEMIAEDGTTVVDAVFGDQSVNDRIVMSPYISGVMNNILGEMSKEMSNIYKGN